MKKGFLYFKGFIFTLLLAVCLPDSGNAAGSRYLHLTGLINGIYRAEMSLTVNGDTLFGNYLILTSKTPPGKPAWPNGSVVIYLYGKVSSRGVYIIRENPWEKGAVFTGKYDQEEGSLKGEWKSADGLITYPFILKAAKEPDIIPFKVTSREGSVPLLKKSGSPKAHFEYCLLTPVTSALQRIPDSIYSIICSAFYGKPVRKVEPEMLLTSLERSYSENYISTNRSIYEKEMGMSFSWEMIKSMDIIHNSPKLLSFFVEQYSFTGGAHGLQTREYLNVNVVKGRTISIKDLFRGDYEKTLTDLITRKLKKMHDLPDDAKLSENGFFVDTVKPTENFYITPNGIGFYYNHYEIAPYSNGPDDVFIPFSEMKDLNPEESIIIR